LIPFPRALLTAVGLLLAGALAAGREPAGAPAQQSGAIRGTVYDADFEAPLPLAKIVNLQTGESATTGSEGTYLLEAVPPGTYTLVFSKEGYVRQVRTDVVVRAGLLTEIDARLTGEFVEMEEFFVQDLLQLGAGSEEALLTLRYESPSLIDSIGADLMSKAGASDAASGLKLVSGATVKEGKSAVIRGLPDRYVSSQMNSVRLPSADEDKRAVELDQFPAAVIESIQVSKTFTPDQQGDSSGGAVDVRLRGIPKESVLRVKTEVGFNSQAAFNDHWLTYDGGGFTTFGHDGGRRPEQLGNLGGNWDGSLEAIEDDAPQDFKLGVDAGTRWEVDEVEFGGFASVFYEHDSSFVDGLRDDSLWRLGPGEPLTPEYQQGAPGLDFKTALFDAVRGTQSVELGGLTTLGVESQNHALALTYLFTRSSEDSATIATDTRGKQYYFPGYDPNDPSTPGHSEFEEAPYIRTDTLAFRKRETETLQLSGRHTLPGGFGLTDAFGAPELDWTVAHSTATSDEPDKRQFASYWIAFGPGLWQPYKPAASFRLGNLQRTFRTLEEESDQYFVNLKLPFEQWDGLEGSVKLGIFDDSVSRSFNQDSYSNFNDITTFSGSFDDPWSGHFPDEDHAITASEEDVDYDGDLDVQAWYTMVDLPLSRTVSMVAGVRFESTDIRTAIHEEDRALWLDPNGVTNSPEDIMPGEADADFQQDDALPAIGLSYRPIPTLTLRGAYAETVARQTFKELSPIQQQEFVGAPVFVGNNSLEMSNLKNYDLRLDYVPVEGSLFSVSWFYKTIEKPIEYVQKAGAFSYTQPENYPDGRLDGYEVEVRQGLDGLHESLAGLSLGANATFIDSQVTLDPDEAAALENAGFPMRTRDATNAPEYLYNLYLTWELEESDTQVGLFWSVQGDTLLSGASVASGGNTIVVPNVYQKTYGSLNLSLSQRLGPYSALTIQAKNLTNPDIETIYRGAGIDDTVKTSYSTGREYSLSLSFHL